MKLTLCSRFTDSILAVEHGVMNYFVKVKRAQE